MSDQDTEITVSMASESDAVQAHFAEAVQDAPPATADDTQAALDHAREAAAHETAAQAAHDQQASYLEHGDIAHAQEMNVTVVHEYNAADVAGTQSELQLTQAQQESASLDGAAWHENTATQHMQDAQIALQSGDMEHATQYAAMADSSASAAGDYAYHGDQDHSYEAHVDAAPAYDASHDAAHDTSSTSSYEGSHADTSSSADATSHVDPTGSDAA